MIESFWTTPDTGDIFIVNGLDAPLRWDGFTAQAEEVGLSPPTTAVVMATSGVGQIVGTYHAFLRFLDKDGNPSNLSPISVELTAHGTTGTITNVLNQTPLKVTSAAHGLTTGTWLKITGVGGIDAVNDTWQIIVIDANTFTLDLSDGDGFTNYTGGGTWISGVSVISYSSVQTPVEPRAVRRQILRNTDGQATTFYVDVDTTDLSSTTFSSTLIDSLLQTNEAVPLLDSLNFPFANRNDKPLSYFKAVCQQLDLMFMAGIVEYNIGSCSLTFGSATVQGVGTDWRSTFAGRFFYSKQASRYYEILSVDEFNQTLTLAETYKDDTDLFGFYSIKPPPAYRRIVQFSVAGRQESWPLFHGLAIQETGDEITGLMQMGAYLYILEKSHVHKLTYAQSPITDGGVFMTATRGCVNNRCWVTVDAASYMLDELGVHKFTGNSQVEPQSDQIDNLFRQDASDTRFRVNWKWKEYFFAVLDKQRDTIRWFVCLDGNRYPRHALVFHYKSHRWAIEEFPFSLGGACQGYRDGFSGDPQVHYGGIHKKVFAAWTGTLDMVDHGTGSARGAVAGATAFSLTGMAIAWPTGILNAPVAIVRGKGKGQVRRVVSVSESTLNLDSPWLTLPDSTSTYQLGGIGWVYRSGWFRLSAAEKMAQRRFEMLFEPLEEECPATLKFFNDFSSAAEIQAVSQTSRDGSGIEVVKGQPDMIVDLTERAGLVDRQLPAGKEYFIRGKRYSQFELSGFTNAEQIRIYQFLYEGGQGET